MPATAAFSVAQLILELLAPILGNLFDASKQEDEDLFVASDETFGLNLGLLVSKQMHNIDINALAPVLLLNLKKNGSSLDINSLRGSKGLNVLVKLVKYALEVNVLESLKDGLAALGLQIPSINQIQKTMGSSQPE